MKKILYISIWVIMTAGIFVLLSFADSVHSKIKCNSFDVNIDYNRGDCFVTIDDVKSSIYQTGDSIKGEEINKINLENIEAIICQNPYVERVDAYITIDGKTGVDVIQRQPILRVFDQTNQSFYIDKNGKRMPVHTKSTARVLVANGNIPLSYYTSFSMDTTIVMDSLIKLPILHKIFYLARYISQNEFLNAQIEQIYINQDNEIELVPTVGSQLIIFGDIDNMKEKFEKLNALYREGFNKMGWNVYKTINLKYKNQVVCSKNENYGI